jgi:hypothetical protein
MATATKRFSRKDLKKPDWFQANSERALDFFAEHKSLVVGAVIALVLMAAVLLGWQQFKARQNIAAAREYAVALDLFHGQKYQESIAAFETVQRYRWSQYSPLAHIYLANTYLALNDTGKAASAAQRSVTATRPNTLYRQIALIALATAEERRGQCQAAIEHFREAGKIPAALQSRALLGRAQCAEQIDDHVTAVQALKEYLKDNPGSPFAFKLAELEAKSAESKSTN